MAITVAARRLAKNAGAIAVSAAVVFVVAALIAIGYQVYVLRDAFSETALRHIAEADRVEVSPWGLLPVDEYPAIFEPVVQARLSELQDRLDTERALLFVYRSGGARMLAAEARAVNVAPLPIQLWVADTNGPGFKDNKAAHWAQSCTKLTPGEMPADSQVRIAAEAIQIKLAYSCPYDRYGYVSVTFSDKPTSSDELIFEYLREASTDIGEVLGWE